MATFESSMSQLEEALRRATKGFVIIASYELESVLDSVRSGSGLTPREQALLKARIRYATSVLSEMVRRERE